jgi:ACS family hexuronate transporter-like MFS transporter
VADADLAGDDFALPAQTAAPWAWVLCWLMFASTVLNYMDRQAIALVNPLIKEEFQLTDQMFGWVLAAFYLTYAFFQVPAGYLTDQWNVRWTYGGAVAWWSAAAIASAFSPTLGILMIFRALLGVGESFNWPCALRVTATTLPPSDRSLGNGIFNSGAAIGAVLTPLIVPSIAKLYSWRVAFTLIGVIGFLWVGVWLITLADKQGATFASRKPALLTRAQSSSTPLSVHSQLVFLGVIVLAIALGLFAYPRYGLSAIWWAIALVFGGLLLVARVLPLPLLQGTDWSESLGEIVRLKRFWTLAVVSISINVCWHFLVNWIGTFFQAERKLGLVQGGMAAAVPFLAADLGNLAGGAFSRFLAVRGWTPRSSRITVVAAGALLLSGGLLVGRLRSDAALIVTVSLMALGAAAYMANYFAFTQDVSPRNTGLVVGILGGLGNLFAAGFMPITGMIKDRTGGFSLSFMLVALLPWVGVTALITTWPIADHRKPS